jgi:hypothetical protein
LTATPTAPGTPTPDADTATPAVSQTPVPTVPADWATYDEPDRRFQMRYPPEWTLEDGADFVDRSPGHLTTVMASFPLDRSVKEFPKDGLKVDLIVFPPVPGNDCRETPDGASPAKLGGVSGWQLTQRLDDPGVYGSVMVAAFRDDYCYTVTGYFGEDLVDDPSFWQIVGSLDFTAN